MGEKMLKTVARMLHNVAPVAHKTPQKVTIVGVGAVGMACAYSILQGNICSELCLVDVVENKVKGEMMDLQHGQAFTGRTVIRADTNPIVQHCPDFAKGTVNVLRAKSHGEPFDAQFQKDPHNEPLIIEKWTYIHSEYDITDNSKLCIITAGLRQKTGETRLSLVQRNTDVFKKIIPELVKHSPETILLVVANPVDVLTYVTWKLSGLPRERVIGSGTHLDSARFRYLIAEKFNISASSCHGWIIGEHGDSSVPVWSGVNVAGISLSTVSRQVTSQMSSEMWEEDIHKRVVDSAYEIIKMKGYTCWGIGLAVEKIAKGVMRNSHNIYALSINVKGMHGITDDVFLSLPCVLGIGGITHIVRQDLNQEEISKLHKSWKTLYEVQTQIKF